jgi:hypothetical protein
MEGKRSQARAEPVRQDQTQDFNSHKIFMTANSGFKSDLSANHEGKTKRVAGWVATWSGTVPRARPLRGGTYCKTIII